MYSSAGTPTSEFGERANLFIRTLVSVLGVLQLAYSGELGAAIAYRGHAASMRDPEERHQRRDARA